MSKRNEARRQHESPKLTIEATMEDMIKTVDLYFVGAAEAMLRGSGNSPEWFDEEEKFKPPFDRFFPYFQRWLSGLAPQSDGCQRDIESALEKIKELIERDPSLRPSLVNIDNQIYGLCYEVQEVAYRWGILVGARFSGAQIDEIRALASPFVSLMKDRIKARKTT